MYTVTVKWSFLKTWKEFSKSSVFSDPKFYLRVDEKPTKASKSLRGVRYDAGRVHIPKSSEVILKERKVCFYEQSRLRSSCLFTDCSNQAREIIRFNHISSHVYTHPLNPHLFSSVWKVIVIGLVSAKMIRLLSTVNNQVEYCNLGVTCQIEWK